MLKKLIIATAVFAATTSVYAASPYLGLGVGEQTNTGNLANWRGLTGSVLAGYGGVINQNFYLAGEFDGTLGSTSISTNTTPTATNIKSTYGYGVSILPGLMLSDHTLAFLRLGIVRTRFTGPSSNVNGGQAGLGLQTSLTPCWDLRGEYIYTAYNSAKPISGNPRADQFNLSLMYKFE